MLLRMGATALLLVTVALGLAKVVRDAAGRLVSGAPARADELVVGLAAVVALVLVGWVLLGAAVAVLATVPGAVGRGAGALADRLAPSLVRRAVAMAFGVTVAAGAAPGASVAAVPPSVAAAVEGAPDPGFAPLPDPRWVAPTGPQSAEDVATGWVPRAPVVRRQPALRVLAPSRAAPTLTVDEVVVRRGDTLWSIAARQLGDDASDAEIAAAWPHWYAANRAVVGDDPDLLHPGQVLTVPAPRAS